MFLAIILFCVGLLFLSKSSDWLVDGASSFATKFNIPNIVIGLTIVAFGTSAPELIVSVLSALQGNTDIALGNVVGSNIFNILIVLGICAVICPLTVKKSIVTKEIPFSLAGVIIVLAFGLSYFLNNRNLNIDLAKIGTTVAELNIVTGICLMILFFVFLYYVFAISTSQNNENGEPDQIKSYTTLQSVGLIVAGLIGLGIGAKIGVDNAVVIGREVGLSESVIGLTIVSAGTSMPELFASVKASLKKNSDIAIGNVVGSNIFNILFILAVTVFIKNIPVTTNQIIDLIILTVISIILTILILTKNKYKLGKFEGIIMIVLYVFYTAFLLNWK
jgi:cation:H+ antiporter